MEFLDLTVEQLASGYIETEFTYECIYCDFKTFKTEIYNYNDKFYTALGMMQLHILIEHESSLNMLLNLSKKENGLSEHQVDLINMINKGYSDKQIANELKLKESTIRYQRFTLREKEKQSKIYLAIMKSLKQKPDDAFLNIHSNAKQVDERYIATKEDEEKVKQDFFESLDPLKLKLIPRKEKYKIIVLRLICQQLEKSKYSESELNDVLIDIYEDYASLKVNKITTSSDNIKGKTVPNSNIIVVSQKGTVGTAQADKNGKFEVKIPPMISGTSLEILVYDDNIFSILYKFQKIMVRKSLFTS